jgi:hypothetical protein
MDTKQCSRCKEIKPVGEFHLRSKTQPWPKSACKDCHRERAKGYWKKNPLPKEVQRERNLKKSFGITIGDYERLLEKQGGVCAICGVSACSSGRNFAVDHCHKSGNIRGLLCKFCNTALGQFQDSKQNLLNAISYLERDDNGNS